MKNIKSFVFCLVVFLVCLSCSVFSYDIPMFFHEEIIVSALKSPEKIDVLPWSYSVLQKSEIKESLAETLRNTQGVDIKSTGYLGATSTGRLRGSTSQQVLVMKDGVRLNSPLLGLVDFSDLNLYDVEKIEIVKAPLSSLYGSDAIGGIINLITDGENKEKNKFSVAYGTYSTVNGKVSLNTDPNKANLYALKTEGFRQNSDLSSFNFSDKVSFDFFGKSSFYAGYVKSDKGVPGVPNSASDPYSASTPNDRQKDENLNLSFFNTANFNGIKQDLKIYNNNSIQEFHNYDFASSSFLDTSYKSGQAGVEISHFINGLLYGIDLGASRGESDYAGNHDVSNSALYVQKTFLNGPFNFVLGARGDQTSLLQSAISPRGGIGWKVSDDFSARASLGTAFKSPTLNDLYWNDPVWQMYGDKNLKPERSVNFEAGLKKDFNDYGNIDLSYYRTSVNDLIMWDWNTTTYVTQAKNVGRTEISGCEIGYLKSITEKLSGFANLTYEDVIDGADVNPLYVGKTVPYSPKLKYTLGIKAGDNVKISLRHVGERYADSQNTLKIPEYTIVDVSMTKDFGLYYAGLTIDNLFNEVYYESMGYHPVTYEKRFYPMPGRVMTVKFGGYL